MAYIGKPLSTFAHKSIRHTIKLHVKAIFHSSLTKAHITIELYNFYMDLRLYAFKGTRISYQKW
jgi:hypothetical protein